MPDKPWRVPVEDVRRTVICDWTEKQFQSNVLAMAKALGWMVYHTFDSRRSAAGFPDLVLVHPGQRRVLFWELKTEKGRVAPAQKLWISALAAVGMEAKVMRPSDWVNGTIENELRGKAVA